MHLMFNPSSVIAYEMDERMVLCMFHIGVTAFSPSKQRISFWQSLALGGLSNVTIPTGRVWSITTYRARSPPDLDSAMS